MKLALLLFVALAGLWSILADNSTLNTIIIPPANFHLDIDGVSVAPGFFHACTIEKKHGVPLGGKVVCWGDKNVAGPMLQPPTDVLFVQVAVSDHCTCALSVDQTVYCWGCPHFNPAAVNLKKKSLAGNVFVPDGLYTQITASSVFFAGIRVDGSIWMFAGANDFAAPVNYPEKFIQVSCALKYCCAITERAHVHCFGGPPLSEEDMEPPMVTVEHKVLDENDVFDVYSSESEAAQQLEVERGKVTKPKEEFFEDEEEEDEEEEDEEDEEAEGVASLANSPTPKGSSGANSSNKLEKRVSVQVKQISCGDHLCCGITLMDEDLICWPVHVDGALHMHHRDQPLFVKGPFRQVSVGAGDVCAIRRQQPLSDGEDSPPVSDRTYVLDHEGHFADDEFERVQREIAKGRHPGMHCWGGARAVPLSIQWWSVGWDQVHIGASGSMCFVSMESRLLCLANLEVVRRVPDIEVA